MFPIRFTAGYIEALLLSKMLVSMLHSGKFIFNWFGAGGSFAGVCGPKKTCTPEGGAGLGI